MANNGYDIDRLAIGRILQIADDGDCNKSDLAAEYARLVGNASTSSAAVVVRTLCVLQWLCEIDGQGVPYSIVKPTDYGRRMYLLINREMRGSTNNDR